MAELQSVTLQEISRKIDSVYAILVSMQSRLEYQLTTPEERAKMAEKAKEILEKLRKEADAELEHELEKRRQRGVGKDGDAITDDDLKTLDSY